MSEGIAGVQARIAEIQRLVNAGPAAKVATTTTSTGATTSTSTSSATAGTDFASALNRATGSKSLEELRAYGNGKIPLDQLVSIGSNERLAGPAAEMFLKMKGDAAAAGIKIGVNDGYRSYAEQVEMARTKGLYGKGGLAAVPGRSNHGWGVSVDLQLNASAQRWMSNNAGKYDFVNDVRGEPWHWTFKP